MNAIEETASFEFVKKSGALTKPWDRLASYDDYYVSWQQAQRARDEHLEKFGFAILDKKTVELVKSFSPILEVGAGSGYWAHELQLAGAIVKATDPGAGSYRSFGYWKKLWAEVERLDAVEAVSQYPDWTLLTVWPDLAPPTWPLEMLHEYAGPTVLYVGEGHGGCTGSDEFHELLEEKFDLVSEINIPQFDGIHDRLFVYQRKP